MHNMGLVVTVPGLSVGSGAKLGHSAPHDCDADSNRGDSRTRVSRHSTTHATAMAPALTPRSIPHIFDNPNDASFSPIVQVFDIKPLAAKTGERRFRILCSDGDHAAQGLLSTSMNELVDAGRVNKFTIMKLKEYTVQEVSKKMCVRGFWMRCRVCGHREGGVSEGVNGGF